MDLLRRKKFQKVEIWNFFEGKERSLVFCSGENFAAVLTGQPGHELNLTEFAPPIQQIQKVSVHPKGHKIAVCSPETLYVLEFKNEIHGFVVAKVNFVLKLNFSTFKFNFIL